MGLFTGTPKTDNTAIQTTMNSCSAFSDDTIQNDLLATVVVDSTNCVDIAMDPNTKDFVCPIDMSGVSVDIGISNVDTKVTQEIAQVVNSTSDLKCTQDTTSKVKQKATSSARGFAFSDSEANNTSVQQVGNAQQMVKRHKQSSRGEVDKYIKVNNTVKIRYSKCNPFKVRIGNVKSEVMQTSRQEADLDTTLAGKATTKTTADQTAKAESVGPIAALAEALGGFLFVMLICFVVVVYVFGRIKLALFGAVLGNKGKGKGNGKSKRLKRWLFARRMLWLGVFLLWAMLSSGLLEAAKPNAPDNITPYAFVWFGADAAVPVVSILGFLVCSSGMYLSLRWMNPQESKQNDEKGGQVAAQAEDAEEVAEAEADLATLASNKDGDPPHPPLRWTMNAKVIDDADVIKERSITSLENVDGVGVVTTAVEHLNNPKTKWPYDTADVFSASTNQYYRLTAQQQ